MGKRTIEEYMTLPYTIEVIRDTNPENPGWVARVVELPGCFTQSDTFEGLEGMIQDAMRGWLEIALADGLPIPEPRQSDSYSGKFIVRLPKSLHRQLAEGAQREGVSLNQYVTTILAKAVGATEARPTPGIHPSSSRKTGVKLPQTDGSQIFVIREEKQNFPTSKRQEETE